ncbi:baseplate J/gp47 family protein [Anaerotruncus colihominis]|jgi:baseplate J-like protein|uniref:Baseplate J-like protein n=2 Tax=Anaerotruncus colihominis TaxID=169435 RepID=B0P625_9FIRM|nr:baseplate J/gp47 family protein [Anaerotruncus colihominis]EDS13182.1 baseplate J-like protein [Anaerotruncus colihominis DSM 17241]MCQ4735151.1 baseplate J/gp47 family protein [Anaerotruncus colihominis]RGE66695.1 phage baseplate protein [Anaerotruncus colihominis]UWN75751.1 baseplate J/gp47 family protein [Anaerotruncus colihominis]
MGRNTEYQFISTDAAEIVSLLTTAYEKITGITIHPASPEHLFIRWMGNIIIQERVLNNYTGNQNIPSRAEGRNLDALGELFLEQTRPGAKPARCTVRFEISEAQLFAVLVPAGTRVTDTGGVLIWQTEADIYVPAGETSVDAEVICQTSGTVGNGYVPGQIDTIMDLYDYCTKCVNITASDGGADMATDEEYYELMRASMDGYSCAGARGGYIYFARRVSTEIADVIANSPTPGVVKLYILMENGEPAGEEIKNAVLAACNEDTVRPLTDQVFVEDAEKIEYDISCTYYIQEGVQKSAAELKAAVNAAVKEYAAWQSARMGRDINPSYLVGLLMQTGIKRVELTAPVFTVLRDGSDRTVPQVAALRSLDVVDGGYEDE